jgi:hypothetical protein
LLLAGPSVTTILVERGMRGNARCRECVSRLLRE